jgi:hypothetical protein
MKIVIILVLFLISAITFSEDFGQGVSGFDSGLEADSYYKKIKSDNPDLGPGEKSDEYQGVVNPGSVNYFSQDLSDNSLYENPKKSLKDANQNILGSMDGKGHYLEHDIEKMTQDIALKGNYAIGINYFRDTYDYESPQNVFENTYRKGVHAHNIGTLQLVYDYFLSRKESSDFSLGINFGYGYNSGRGIFTQTRDESKAVFRLITLPLDFSVKYALRTSRWLKFGVSGGPSLMGLYQTRSDRETGESGKRRRQVGFGYFAQLSAKMSLSDIYPAFYYKLFDTFSITKVWFGIYGRHQNYSNFLDEISISGNSLGIGFTFEYL